MGHYYTRDANGEPQPADLLTWASWFEDPTNRRVARDEVGDHVVSTVFLGADHGYGAGPPVLWETMVFGPNGDDYGMDRYSSAADAAAGHARMMERVACGKPRDQV